MFYVLKRVMFENKSYLLLNIVTPAILALLIKMLRQSSFIFFSKNSIIFNFIRYNLIDGLWLYSFCCLMLLIWDKEISKNSLFWLLPIFLICLSHELLQKSHMVRGTFDYIDFITYIIAFLASILLNLNFKSIKQIDDE